MFRRTGGTVLLILALCLGFAEAQTPVASLNTAGDIGKGTRARAANNPWIGSQVTANLFGDNGTASDWLFVAARLIYEVSLSVDRFHLPVMGNISEVQPSGGDVADQLKELAMGQSGAVVGLFPYYEIPLSNDFLLTVHGGVALKWNGFNSSPEDGAAEEVVYLRQLRTTFGAEAVIGNRNDGRGTMTLSVAPSISLFSGDAYMKAFGKEESNFAALEVTAVLPLGDGVGLLCEWVDGEGSIGGVRLGLLASAGT